MYEPERKEIIDSINEIRRGVGLEPFDEEQLSEMEVEELKNLYRRQLELRESFEKPIKGTAEGPRINLKQLLLVVIPIACIALGLVFYFFIFKNLPIGGKSEEEDEEGSAETSVIISECNDMIDVIITINNSCVSDEDCNFTSFCNCVNAMTYIDVEGLIEDSICKDHKQADCVGLQCLCDNSECVVR